jgi:hypothetical protein
VHRSVENDTPKKLSAFDVDFDFDVDVAFDVAVD